MEITSLIFAGALIWISVLVQHVSNVRSKGTQFVMSDRAEPLADSGFTGRATRALRNNMESALMYLPIALVPILGHQNNALTYDVAAYWMLSRCTFTFGYWFKINLLRSLSWFTGMLAIAILAVKALAGALAG